MITCYRCAKIIQDKTFIRYNPPIYLIRLGLDFNKSFHTKCYHAENAEAEKELTHKKEG